jgi:hypothetical protein
MVHSHLHTEVTLEFLPGGIQVEATRYRLFTPLYKFES